MRKAKVADMARTSPSAMAPAPAPEPSEDDKIQSGGYDLDHLMRAEEIKADPKKMEYVHKAHKKKMTAMRSIQDLKDAAQALAHKGKADDAEEAGESPAEEKGEAAQPRAKTRYPKK